MSIGWYRPRRVPEGEVAPDFRLQSTDGEFHLHGELEKGPLLMMFYMGDFGTGCTLSLNRLAELVPELEALGVRTVAMSVNSIDLHRRFLARMDFPFPLISDPGGEVAELYGVRIGEHILYKNMSGRGVYLMGRDGRILHSWVHPDDPAGNPDFPNLVENVRASL